MVRNTRIQGIAEDGASSMDSMRNIPTALGNALKSLGDDQGTIEYLADHGVELSRSWYGPDREKFERVAKSALAFVHNLLVLSKRS